MENVKSIEAVERMFATYDNMLFRTALVLLGNRDDAEDAVHETVIKYMQKSPVFESAEHEKAWLLRVITNQCRDMQRFWLNHPQTGLEDIPLRTDDPESCGIIELLMELPLTYKLVMVLYYVEQSRVEEIAALIGKTPSAVKMRLQRGRKLLEEKYRKEYL